MESDDYLRFERIATPIERQILDQMLGSLGLYNAFDDTPETEERPEDNKWIILSNN